MGYFSRDRGRFADERASRTQYRTIMDLETHGLVSQTPDTLRDVEIWYGLKQLAIDDYLNGSSDELAVYPDWADQSNGRLGGSQIIGRAVASPAASSLDDGDEELMASERAALLEVVMAMQETLQAQFDKMIAILAPPDSPADS